MISQDPKNGDLICTCYRCAYRWYPCVPPPGIPKQCPRCKSRYWNKVPLRDHGWGPPTDQKAPHGFAKRNPDGSVKHPPPLSPLECDLTYTSMFGVEPGHPVQ